MRIPAILLASLVITSLHAQVGLEHRFIHPAEASALAILDLDGDGDGDVLRATSAGLLVQEQVAPGTYQVTRNLGNADGLTSIHFVDLDGDGDHDLLLPFRTSGAVRWAQGLGGGNFAAMADLLSGLNEVFLARAADLDGDMDLDLIYAHDAAGVNISWSENTGGMSYGPGQLILATGIVPTPQHPRFDNFLDLGDLDLDGDTDLAIAYSALRWFENDGSGAFTTHVLSGTPPGDHILLADIDGDLDTDMLLAGLDSDAYRALNDGVGNFGPITPALQVVYPGAKTTSLKLMDMEGDGDLDLYLWYLSWNLGLPDELVRCVNDGSGTFTYAGDIMVSNLFQPYAVGYADGDQTPDVLGLGNHALQLHLSGGGGLLRLNSVAAPLCLALHGTQVIVCSNTSWGPTLEGPRPLQLAGHVGLGGDLRHQPIEYWVSASGISRVDVAELDGGGPPDLLLEWRDPNTGTTRRQFVMSVINGDSITAVGNNYFGLIPGAIVPCIRDLDLDGDNDVLRYSGGPVKVNLNTGNGWSEQEHWLDAGNLPTGVTLCRVDADGHPDFVWWHATMLGTDSVRWNLNDGTGAPQPTAPGVIAPIRAYSNGSMNSPGIATHDLDQDGQEELILFNGDSIAFMSVGNGTLSLIQTMPCPAVAYTLGDMDGDTHPDLVALLQNGDLVIRLNLGNGTMGGMLTLATAAQHTGRDHLILADVSGDGALDVVTCAASGSAAWLENLFNSPYRAEGQVWHDLNADGVRDPGEGPLPFVLSQCDPSSGYPMTDTTGAYSFSLAPGHFVLSSLVPDTLWALTTDSSEYHIALDALNPVSTGNDFGFTPAVIVTNLEPTLVGSMYMCDSYSSFFVQATNLGTTIPDGHLAVELDTAFTFHSASPAPDSVVGRTVHWSFDDLYYYSTYGAHLIVEGPALALLGMPVTNTCTLEASIGGVVVQTTTSLWTDTVTCAWDPNDKQVSPKGVGDQGAIDIATDHLDYTIRFQNTGNAPAMDVILRDVLDVDLDPASVTLLGYSHSPTDVLIRADGTLEFRFEGIALPDSGADLQGSQGFVKFRISLDNGLPHLTTIENSAAIYFDLNPPVITNTVLNTLVDCSLHEALVNSPAPDVLEASAGIHYQWFLNGLLLPGDTLPQLLPTQNGDYTVQVTSAYGCVALSDPYTYTANSLPDAGGTSLRLAPNPMNEMAVLQISEMLTAQHRIELVDVSGRVLRVLRPTGRSVTLFREGLGAGAYILRLMRDEEVIGAVRVLAQ
ncbi:MAG: VCBS repeat-containing protein [Flavobacteriales bacterium]|nr:VCBS repeat-containing protein [Flavobacteriales bacterium]